MSLRSLGLSKDPKDAQRQPSCFPDAMKGAYAQTEMRAKFLMLRCLEKGECEGFLERIEVEERGACASGSKDQ